MLREEKEGVEDEGRGGGVILLLTSWGNLTLVHMRSGCCNKIGVKHLCFSTSSEFLLDASYFLSHSPVESKYLKNQAYDVL